MHCHHYAQGGTGVCNCLIESPSGPSSPLSRRAKQLASSKGCFTAEAGGGGKKNHTTPKHGENQVIKRIKKKNQKKKKK
ncbi:MAG: hypothetical protein ACTHK7_00400, partial [Aureliella sp.]